MIIRKMKATFGTLAGEELKLDRGLNIIYAPNESTGTSGGNTQRAEQTRTTQSGNKHGPQQ